MTLARRAAVVLTTAFALAALACPLAPLPASAAPEARPVEGAVAEDARSALAGGTAVFEHAAWDALLAKGVRDGLVDYRFFQERRADLDRYLDRVGGARLGELRAGELEALLVNAYNALTIRSILEHPEVRSIRDIPGVWDRRRHRVGGHELTLDEIEHRILRPFFRDPRLHFALNCAALSCPPLAPRAYDGARIGEQLETATRAYLGDPRNVRVEDGAVVLPRLLDWYGGDFSAADSSPRADSVAGFAARYAAPETAARIRALGPDPRVRFLDYDWALNAAVPPLPPLRGARGREGLAGFVLRLGDRITELGPTGVVLYILVYAAASAALLPAWPLTVLAGASYGLGWGMLLATVSAVAGAGCAFLASRYLLRGRVERFVAESPRFAAVDRAIGRDGWKIVALTRLSPIFPYNVLNYLFGLTSVGFWPYLAASAAGMLPGTLLYVWIGAAGRDVAAAAAGESSAARTVIRVGGLGATLLVTLLLGRIARQALRESGAAAEASPAASPPSGAA